MTSENLIPVTMQTDYDSFSEAVCVIIYNGEVIWQYGFDSSCDGSIDAMTDSREWFLKTNHLEIVWPDDEPIIFEYLACWIGYTSDLTDLAVKLRNLGLRSVYQNFDVFGSGSLKYVFQANESDMIQWRECLVGHNLDPFYVHNVRQIG